MRAAQFRKFAAVECPQDPLYVAICQAVADAPALLALMDHAPPTQARPNLLLAALHERVLAGVEHPLAAYYPSVGGERMPDAALPALLLDFAQREQTALIAHLRQRSTQTNEIGRCAVLWPALAHIAALAGGKNLALLDFGSSAGLNLGVDGYCYDYGRFSLGAPAATGRPQVACDWRGEPPAASTAWRLVSRLGLDVAPVDLQDEAAARWLRACVWPHDRERAQRLDLAIACAQAARWQVLQADDGLAAVEAWLDALPADLQPVLFNSWVLAYFEPPALAQFQAQVARWVRERGLVWLSAEAPALRPPGLALPPPDGSGESATLWSLQWADDGGQMQQTALAWSHPHGRWLHWL
ncbi:DUF2332 domain-containing protein [soil metagenome]